MIDLDRPLLTPDFFDLHFDLNFSTAKSIDSNTFLLKNMARLLEQDAFCKCYAAWSPKGLRFDFVSSNTFVKGDQILIAIDTRDLKTAHMIHKHCHLFRYTFDEKTPTFVEITHFRRREDSHELCDPTQLETGFSKGLRKQSVQLFIPSSCLVGFDPARFDRLGLHYALEKKLGKRQDFSLSHEIWAPLSNPSLWPTMHLTK